jgi:HD-like signal output (HDOD) protein
VILLTAFSQRGFQVYDAKTSSVNYLQILQFRPDYILLEVLGPHQEQIALLRLLRKNDRLAKVPVITYGTKSDPMMLVDLKVAGSFEHMLRPLKLATIFDTMKRSVPSSDIEGAKLQAAKSREEERNEDLQKLINPKVDARTKLDLMVKHTGKLMSFPFAITKVLQVTQGENSGAEDLAKIINGDPSLSTTILKVANSIHFGSSKRISNSKEAIMRLGFNEVRTISIGLKVMELFPDKVTFGFQRMDFWCYALGRALIAEKLGKHLRLADPTLAFLSGLLADFAVLIFDSFFPMVFEAILKKIAEDGTSFEEATQGILGFHPQELVVLLLEMWRLPADLVKTIADQRGLYEQKEDLKPDGVRLLADCVALSSALARAGEIGHGCDDHVQEVPNSIMRELRLPAGVSPAFFDPVYSGLKIYATFFGIETKLLPHPVEDPTTLPKALFLRIGKTLFDPHFLFLSHSFQFTTVRNPEELKKALAESTYRAAVLEYRPEAPISEVSEILELMVPVKNDQDRAIPVFSLLPPEVALATPPGLNMVVHAQSGDLRKLSLVLETQLAMGA